MAGATIDLHLATTDAESRFLREYLVEAWGRFEASDHWETGWFWAYRQFSGYESGPDGGFVQLVFEGDPDRLEATESPRWEAFDGLESWSIRRYAAEGYDGLLDQQRDAKGDVAGEWDYRLKPLVSRFSLAFLAEFPEGLPAVADETEGDPIGLGFWTVIHYAMVQCGYDWYDETDACRRAMENRLRSLGAYRGADAATEEYERLLDAWRNHGDELAQWLAENPTGDSSIG